MIIKSSRVAASGVSRFLINHLLRGDENDAVAILSGGSEQMTQCISDATAKGCRYAIRHFIISPDQPLTGDEVRWIVEELAKEFGFRPGNVTLVRHMKERRGLSEEVPHFHVAVPEVDPAIGGKVLSSRWSYPRQEKIARAAELRFGHRPTPGPWQKSVVTTLDAEGRTEEANALRHLEPSRDPGKPSTTINPGVLVHLKREGVDFDEVRAVFELSATAAEFTDRLAAMGLRVAPGGRRTTTPCLYKEDEHLAALHRVLSVSVVDLRTFLDTQPTVAVEPTAETFLSREQIIDGLSYLQSQIQPQPFDRTDIDNAEATHRRLFNDEKVTLAKVQDAEDRLKALEEERATETAKFGWFARHLLQRSEFQKVVADFEEKRIQTRGAVEIYRHLAKECTASRVDHNPDLRRARQVLESRTAFYADKAQSVRKAFDQAANAALSGRFRFRDQEELHRWVASRGPGTDIVDRTDIWGIGQPAPQARRL